MRCGEAARVAIVLPPNERFSPEGAGAISLLVSRLARAAPALVVGMPVATPFAGTAFRAARPLLRPAPRARRYAAGVALALRGAEPDIVEVYNRPDVALDLARRFGRVSLVLQNDPQDMRRARSDAERQHLLNRMAGIAAASDWLRQRLLRGVTGGTVTVLPNSVDLNALPRWPPAREKLILFAGRVVADKGADSFVEACARALPRLSGWQAEMVGGDRFGADSPDTPFLRAIRPRAAAAGVVMRGWQPNAAVLDAMSRAAIVVVPSRWPEPFGIVALEAMGCGAALLYAPRGGLPEVAGDAGVPIDPDDPHGMAEAIVALALDPARRAALAEAGRLRAVQFDLGTAATRLLAWRTRLIG